MSVAPKWRAVWHEYDKNERQRGNDAGEAPLLGDREGAAGEGDVVIGGKESDQAEGQASDGLGEAKGVEAGPGA